MLDPLHTTALESLDFGDVLSPDGRAHPMTANTSIYPVDPVSATPVDPGTQSGAQAVLAGETLFGLFKTQHIAARTVVGLVAIGILLIVVVRLVK